MTVYPERIVGHSEEAALGCDRRISPVKSRPRQLDGKRHNRAEAGRLEDYGGRRNVAQLVVCNCGARCILVVSTDDDWVASPVPGQAAKTDKIVPGFEFGKIHFRSEGRRAVLDLSIACGR